MAGRKSSAVWATSRQPWSIVREWPRLGIVVFTFASVRGLMFALPIWTIAIPEPATWKVS